MPAIQALMASSILSAKWRSDNEGEGGGGGGDPEPTLASLISACPSPTAGSMYFSNKSSRDSTWVFAPNADFDIADQDTFQIEWWSYQYPTENRANMRLWEVGAWPSTDVGVSFEGNDINGRNFLLWLGGEGNTYHQMGSTFTPEMYLNQWVHWCIQAVPFDDGQGHDRAVSLYLHGQWIYTIHDNTGSPLGATANLVIGGEDDSVLSSSFSGHVADFRWLKGERTYEVGLTESFTPPNAPHNPAEANPVLLLQTLTSNDAYDDHGVNTLGSTHSAIWSRSGPFDVSTEPNVITSFPFTPDFDFYAEPGCDCLVNFSGFTEVMNDSNLYVRSSEYPNGPALVGSGYQIYWRDNPDVLTAGNVVALTIRVKTDVVDPFYWLQITRAHVGGSNQVAYQQFQGSLESDTLTLTYTVQEADFNGNYHYEFCFGSVNDGEVYEVHYDLNPG